MDRSEGDAARAVSYASAESGKIEIMVYPEKERAALEQRLLDAGPEPTRERMEALNELAYSLMGLEEWDRMQTLAQEAAEIARTLADAHGEARALGIIAFVRYIRSDFKAALASCM